MSKIYKEDEDIYMTFEEYQTYAKRTARAYENKEITLAVLSMGLAGESGELIDMLKKVVGHGHELDLKHVKKELGDILWYWVLLCDHFNLEPSKVAWANVEKLRARYPKGFTVAASVERKEENEG